MASVPTTLETSAGLKERVASIEEGTGKTAHAFMLEAIEQQTRNAEKRKQFIADGQASHLLRTLGVCRALPLLRNA
ncbi:MAG: hypothetical protein H0V78_06720 [Burkholderiales bacterium]|nr:hypothetical protein [Burkholderiales bacterium]